MKISHVRKLALSFPEATEEPHFEKTSFRVRKKIFASYDASHDRICVKLSEVDQDVFSAYNKNLIFPVPNKWGKQGWTFFKLKEVPDTVISDALTCAYCEVAPSKLVSLIK